MIAQGGSPGIAALALLRTGIINGNGKAFLGFGFIGIFEEIIFHSDSPLNSRWQEKELQSYYFCCSILYHYYKR